MKAFLNDCRIYQRLTALFLLLLAIGCVIAILTPAGIGWDFANFYDTGRRVAAGQVQDIYKVDSLIGGESPQGLMSFWGTPLSAWLYVPLSWFSPETALIVFKIQNTLAYFLALGLLFFLNRQFVEEAPISQWKFAALFVGICLLYQPFWTVYRVGGQATPTVFLLFSLALVAFTRSYFSISAVCLVGAAMIKPAFGTALILLMCISGIRFFVTMLAVLFIAGVGSLLVMGWDIHVEFLLKMLNNVKIVFPWFYNSSLYITVEHLRLLSGEGGNPFMPNLVFDLINGTMKICLLGVFIVLIRKSHSFKWSSQSRNHFLFLTAISFGLFLSPTVWEHYLAMLFLPLAYCLAVRRYFSPQAFRLIIGIVLLSIGQNLIVIHGLQNLFTFDSWPELVLICLFKSAPLILMLIFLMMFHQTLFNSYQDRLWNDPKIGCVTKS